MACVLVRTRAEDTFFLWAGMEGICVKGESGFDLFKGVADVEVPQPVISDGDTEEEGFADFGLNAEGMVVGTRRDLDHEGVEAVNEGDDSEVVVMVVSTRDIEGLVTAVSREETEEVVMAVSGESSEGMVTAVTTYDFKGVVSSVSRGDTNEVVAAAVSG